MESKEMLQELNAMFEKYREILLQKFSESGITEDQEWIRMDIRIREYTKELLKSENIEVTLSAFIDLYDTVSFYEGFVLGYLSATGFTPATIKEKVYKEVEKAGKAQVPPTSAIAEEEPGKSDQDSN